MHKYMKTSHQKPEVNEERKTLGKVHSHIPDNDAIQELIRTVIQRLSKKRPGVGISRKKILKVLYQVKKTMPDDNPLKKKLAYYWYLEGPFSTVVYENVDLLEARNVVTKSRETYKLVKQHVPSPLFVPSGEYVDSAKKEIGRVCEEFVNIDDAVEGIYDNDAPYAWYRTYKLEFMPKFESYCKAELEERDNRYHNKDIEDRLDDAVLDYPALPEFAEHRMIFMDFAKMLNALLNSTNLSSDKRREMLHALGPMAEKIWKAFAERTRIEHHDDYYAGDVERWKIAYNDHISDLDREITWHLKNFESIADDRTLAPELEDIILHPERHDFKRIVIN